MSMNVASELRDHLDTFDEHIRTLGNEKPNSFFFDNIIKVLLII